jgi:nicotinamide riboside kinase
MKIGIMGSHGTGKSGLAAEIAARIGDEKTVVLSEGARQCPFPVNQSMSIKSQRWLLARQLSMEHYAGNDNLVVCDRTVLDPIVYAIWMLEKTNNGALVRFLDAAVPFALDWYRSEYDLVLWCRPDGSPLVADGFRDTDPEFQVKIDAIFERLVDGYGLAFVSAETFRQVYLFGHDLKVAI